MVTTIYQPCLVGAEKEVVLPSGPQTEGSYRKVILETDKDTDGDGKIDDSLVVRIECRPQADSVDWAVNQGGSTSP